MKHFNVSWSSDSFESKIYQKSMKKRENKKYLSLSSQTKN